MHRATSKVGFVVAVLLASIPAAASAAAWRTAESQGLMTPYGEYFLVGAGATDFTDSALKDAYDTGLEWNARLGFGSRSFLGLELAYIGAMRGAALGNNDITQHGAEAAVRLQFPYVMGTWLVEPFALAGIGWSHVSFDQKILGEDTDEIGTVPLGAGITLGYGRFLIDGRFTYRATFSEDIGNADLENWSVTGAIGYEF